MASRDTLNALNNLRKERDKKTSSTKKESPFIRTTAPTKRETKTSSKTNTNKVSSNNKASSKSNDTLKALDNLRKERKTVPTRRFPTVAKPATVGNSPAKQAPLREKLGADYWQKRYEEVYAELMTKPEYANGQNPAGAHATAIVHDEMKRHEYIVENQDNTYKDNFFGQFAASYRTGDISERSTEAMADYLKTGNKADYNYSLELDELSKRIQENNKEVYDDNATLPWISQDVAGYLPQFFNQTVPQVVGGGVGGTAGAALTLLATKNPELALMGFKYGAKIGATAASGYDSYDRMRASAFKGLIELGADEETAKAAANDEAVLGAITEMGDTWFTLGKFGYGAVLNSLGKDTTKKAAVGGLKKLGVILGKYGLNIEQERAEEGIQGAISVANRRRVYNDITRKADEEIGQYGQGNIDLYNRPQYKYPDGMTATVESASFNIDGEIVLLPTIAYDAKGNAVRLTDDEAFRRYVETGEYLGKFNTEEEAKEYAQKLHLAQDYYYSDNKDEYTDNGIWGLTKDAGNVLWGVDFGKEDKATIKEIEEQKRAGGAIAAVMGSLGTAVDVGASSIQAVNDNKIRKVGKEYSVSTEEVIEEGLESDPNSESYKIASELKEKLDAGEKISNTELGRAVIANEQEIQRENANNPATIEEAAEMVTRETDRTVVNPDAPHWVGKLSTVTETPTETANTKPRSAIGEVNDNTKSILGDGSRTVGVAGGQAFVTNGKDILPSRANRSVFLPVNDVETAKVELGATESDKTGANIAKILDSDFHPISEKIVDGNIEGVGEVRVYTTATDNERQIALTKDVAEYFEGYNLEATFRGGKPYAIKATDDDGNVAGVALAVWQNTSGIDYTITDAKPVTQTTAPSVADTKKLTGFGENGTKAFADIVLKSSGDKVLLASEFNTAYRYGMLNAKPSTIDSSSSVQIAAYEAGLKDYNIELESKKENVKNVISHGESAGFDRTNVREGVSDEAIEVVNKAFKAMGAIGKMVGKSDLYNAKLFANKGVVFVASDFQVDESLGEDAVSKSFIKHSLHELFDHYAEELAPEAYMEFKREMYEYKNQLAGIDLADAKRAAYASREVDISYSEAVSEVTANSIFELFDNDIDLLAKCIDHVLNGKNAKAKTGARNFLKALDWVVEKVNKALEKLGSDKRIKYRSALDDITRLRNTLEGVLSKASEQSKKNAVNKKAEADIIAKDVEAHSLKFNLKLDEKHGEMLTKHYSEDSALSLNEIQKRREKIVEIWNRLGGELNSEFLEQWNNKVGTDRAFGVFKAQAGYKYNVELSSMCKKGIPLFEAIDRIVKEEVMNELKVKALGKAEKEILYDILKEHSLEIPCAICYVEQARQGEGRIISDFLNGKVETNKSGKVTRFKLGWNETLAKIEKEMKAVGVDYTFPSLDRSVATDSYTPADISMDEETQAAYFEALKKVANEEIRRYNKAENKSRPLVKNVDAKSINEVFKGSLPANLSMFKTMFLEPSSRFTIDEDLLYSSMTTQNLADMHNGLYTLFNMQGGTSGYKTKQGAVVYWGDILGKKWDASKLRTEGGVRNQSNSDFMMYTLLDHAQMYLDFTAKGYYLQAYTKVLAELKLFGLSKGKINASFIPRVVIYRNADKSIDVEKTRLNAGLDKNGKPVYDDFEGINHNETFMLIEDGEYSKSIGGVCIGYSDKHILALLDDNRIQLVIGFHDKTNDPDKRYRGAVYAKNYNGENEATRKSNGKTVHLGFNQFILRAEARFKDKDTVKHNGKTYTWNDVPRLATDLYLESCEKRGLNPAYSQGDTDFSKHPNYYKLLADFSLYDINGNYAPHEKVEFNMPDKVPYLDENGNKAYMSTEDYIKRELKSELAVRDDISAKLADKSENGIIPQFVKRVNEAAEKEGSKFSLKDSDYMDAVNKGDTATAQKMVDEAAKKAGYTPKHLYHGTSAFGFTELDVSQSDDGMSFFVSDNVDVAQGYFPYFENEYDGYHDSVREIGKKADRPRTPFSTNAKVDDVIAKIKEALPEYKNARVATKEEVIADLENYWLSKATTAAKELQNYSVPDNVQELVGLVVEASSDGNYDAWKSVADRYSEFEEIYDIYYNGTYFSQASSLWEKVKTGMQMANKLTRNEAIYYDGKVTSKNAAITKYNDHLAGEGNGIYDMFARHDKQLVLRGRGCNWNNIPLGEITTPFNEWWVNEKGHEAALDGAYRRADTRSIAEFAKTHGYRSVCFEDIYDAGAFGNRGDLSTVYAFFYPQEDLKSADPVTYDDEGKVIPLSERFNEKNPDIRYSLKDSEGNSLTKEQQEYFKDSKVRDENGNLLVMYHGTKRGGFTVFDGGKDYWYFTNDKKYSYAFEGRKANGQYYPLVKEDMEKGIIKPQRYKVYLNVTNPYITEDVDMVEDALYWDKSLAGLLRDKGYDALMLKDMSQVIVLNRNQIKNTDNKNPTSNPDIRYSLKGTEKDISLKDVEKVGKAIASRDAKALAKYAESGAISTEFYNQLIETYGVIPKGEKPYRDVSVPAKTSDNKKVSQTVRTILEAKATPDEAVPTIQKMVEDGVFSYDTYTDKQAINDAESYIKEYGWDESLDDWFDAVEKGEVSKELTTMGWALYNNAANLAATTTSETERTTAIKTSLNILNAMVKHQRSAAQALQATRILKKMSPETQLYGVQKSVSAFQKELTDKYGDKAPDLKIDESLAEQFLTAETQEERDAVEEKILKDIGRQMPSRFIDKWNAWRYLAMLGNPRTHIKNIGGNAGFAPIVALKNLTATAIESAVYRVSGKKTSRSKAFVGLGKADRALLKAAWDDYANVADMISNGGKYSDFAMANQQIEEGRRIFKFKPLEMARKGNSKALEMEDMWFSKPHYANALAQYCKANKITAEQLQKGKALGNARQYAIKEAQKATYRDTNAFSQMVSEWGRHNKNEKNVVKKAFNTVVEGILPFRKTPANILVRGVEYSPLGLLKGLSYDLVQVGKGKMTSAEAIDSISAGLTGTGLLALGIYLAAEGLIRGHGEDDEEKEFKEMMGHQAYALELPNGTSVTLDWLAPEALPFFVGVNIWETTSGADEEANLSTILQAVSGISEPMLEMSCLQSLNDVFESVGYASSNDTSGLVSVVSSAATSYLTQGLPTILGQAERTGEEERMTTYTEKNSFLTKDLQYTLGKASAKIPSWDYNQIPYIDAWGRKEASGTALERGLNNFLNPAYTSTIETSSMEKELLRLHEQTGEASVFPTRADKYFMVDGVRKDLTKEEYVRYATLKGQKSYNAVTDLVQSKAYKKLSDEEKAKAVKEAYDYANQKAKQAISNYKPETWVSDADKFGSNVGNYISFKTEVASTKDKMKANGKKMSKQDVVDIVLDMAQNDDEVWNMYLSEFDSKADVTAHEMGIGGEEYMDVLLNMDKYDEPNKNGNLGTYTNDEIEAAVRVTSGLTNHERAHLWQSLTGSSSTKNNPWRRYL